MCQLLNKSRERMRDTTTANVKHVRCPVMSNWELVGWNASLVTTSSLRPKLCAQVCKSSFKPLDGIFHNFTFATQFVVSLNKNVHSFKTTVTTVTTTITKSTTSTVTSTSTTPITSTVTSTFTIVTVTSTSTTFTSTATTTTGITSTTKTVCETATRAPFVQLVLYHQLTVLSMAEEAKKLSKNGLNSRSVSRFLCPVTTGGMSNTLPV